MNAAPAYVETGFGKRVAYAHELAALDAEWLRGVLGFSRNIEDAPMLGKRGGLLVDAELFVPAAAIEARSADCVRALLYSQGVHSCEKCR